MLTSDQVELLRLRMDAAVAEVNATMRDAERFGLIPRFALSRGEAPHLSGALLSPVKLHMEERDDGDLG